MKILESYLGIAKELFGTKDANAFGEGPVYRVTLCGKTSGCGYIR